MTAPGLAVRTRLAYIDNIRVLLTLLVVAHHAAQPYGPTGGSWPLKHPEHSYLLGPFFHVNASFFMGFFFLVSGYFMPRAFDSKGPRKFLKERCQRLGIPILFFALVLFPVLGYVMEGGASFRAYYFDRIVAQHRIEFAHLWFVAHLLVYAAVYALWRAVRPGVPAARPSPFPGNRRILGYVFLLAVTSMAVRIWYPIDRWIGIPVPFEAAHMPQYFSLFVLGVVAYRRGWLEKLEAAAGKTWLAVALAMVVLRFTYTISGARFLRRTPFPDWAAVVWNFWEALLCVGMCIGLLWLFRERVNVESGFQRLLARNAYGVYLVHLPIVVGAQLALRGTPFGPLTLTVLSTGMAVAVSLLVSEGLRRIPGARKVL